MGKSALTPTAGIRAANVQTSSRHSCPCSTINNIAVARVASVVLSVASGISIAWRVREADR